MRLTGLFLLSFLVLFSNPALADDTFPVHATARLSEDGQAIPSDAKVMWKVFRLFDDGKRGEAPVYQGDGGELMFTLPVGTYIAMATLGVLVYETLVEPQGEKTVPIDVIFDAGLLTVTPILKGTNREMPDAKIEMIFVGGRDEGTGRTTRYVGAGSVEVHAVVEGANIRKDIMVAPGQTLETTIEVPAGI